jgi:transcription antitermination factor NusB
MATEKPEKSSGTRHKARECALQMLFAWDLAGSGHFAQRAYWSELGYEQFQSGANTLALSFLTELDTCLRDIDALKARIRSFDNLERISSRGEKLKQLASMVNQTRSSYNAFIERVLDTNRIDPESIHEQFPMMRSLLERFDADLKAHIKSLGHKVADDDIKTCDSLIAHIKQSINKQSSILNKVQTLFESTAKAREFATTLADGALSRIEDIDGVIRTRAEHWRIERMAIVDRNVLRLAVFEFIYQDTPNTVAINEALELARRFSSFEATQFVNGVLDAIKQDRQGGEAKAKKGASN